MANEKLFAPLQTHYAEITIIGETRGDGIYDFPSPADLCGVITGGNLNINGNSAVRRTGSLSMIATESNYKLTDTANSISLNKIINVRIGVSIDGTKDGADWYQLGVFVITGASVTRNLQGWNISVNLQDKMALLNGTCGGTLPGGITHSPIYNEKIIVNDEGQNEIKYESDEVLFRVLVTSLLDEFALGYTGVKNISFGKYDETENSIKNTVRWTSSTPIYGEIKSIERGEGLEPLKMQILSYQKPTTGNIIVYNFNDNIGYSRTSFTFPGELTSGVGDTVASVLEKIKKQLGNFEYFFDINGNFIWREIPNGIHQGSTEDNLLNALADMEYLATRENVNTAYDFDNDSIVVSYQNSPQYSAIKNDFVCWGAFSDSKLPIRYRLVIDKKPEYSETTYSVTFAFDSQGVKRAIKDSNSSITVKSTNNGGDWRQHMYLNYIANDEMTPYAKELKEEWPKIYDVENQHFYCVETNGNAYNTQKFNSIPYYLDILDPDKLQTNDSIKESLQKISVSNIGRRLKPVKDDSVNCIFNPRFSDTLYIPLGQEDTAELRAEAIQQGDNFIQVPQNIAQFIGMGSILNSGYDSVRMVFNENVNYCNSITLQSLPLYFLDANDIISVEDEKSDIHGKFQIKSLSIPLTPTGPMSITASQVITLV